MNLTSQLSAFKFLATIALIILLSACGGGNGFVPVVTGVKVLSVQYGKTATIYIGGKDLRSYLTVETNGACTNPNFANNSTTETLVLNCVVSKVGDFALIIKSAEGQVIHTSTVNVPMPQVALVTSKGAITIALDPNSAPISVNNFLGYVNKGFYRSTLFHRVIPNFVVQGGGYTAGMLKKSGQSGPIILESNNGLSNVRGSLAMARTNLPNSATSEFYINLVDNLSLDYKNPGNPGYAVFGKVVQGLDLVDTIALEPTGLVGGFSDVPLIDIMLSFAIQTQ
jgi:cyclophilin family peptidyl-prolyl cis-trans isomerase